MEIFFQLQYLIKCISQRDSRKQEESLIYEGGDGEFKSIMQTSFNNNNSKQIIIKL